MKTYIWNDTKPFTGKVNFVDSNNIILGYDLNQSCCENAFWTITEDKEGKQIKLNGEDLLGKEIEIEGYVFDPDFYENSNTENQDTYCEDNVAIFRLYNPWVKSGMPDLYIRLENHHNGYYSHGFEFSGGHKISDSL